MYSLRDRFNMSLSTWQIPVIWKCLCIIPIHKGDDVLDPNNYIPISIICSIEVFVQLLELHNYCFSKAYKCYVSCT